MSLPPIGTNSRYILISPIRESKINTSCRVRILNPPFLAKEKHCTLNICPSKASEVMSSKPPQLVPKSKFMTSRLSPMFPLKKSIQNQSKSSFLKKKNIEHAEKGRYSELSYNYKFIRDYFQESATEHEILDHIEKNQVNDETRQTRLGPDVYAYESSFMKPKYSAVVQLPKVVESRAFCNDEGRVEYPKKKQKKTIIEKYINESLQTDLNSFEFDDWELDYDA